MTCSRELEPSHKGRRTGERGTERAGCSQKPRLSGGKEECRATPTFVPGVIMINSPNIFQLGSGRHRAVESDQTCIAWSVSVIRCGRGMRSKTILSLLGAERNIVFLSLSFFVTSKKTKAFRNNKLFPSLKEPFNQSVSFEWYNGTQK